LEEGRERELEEGREITERGIGRRNRKRIGMNRKRIIKRKRKKE